MKEIEKQLFDNKLHLIYKDILTSSFYIQNNGLLFGKMGMAIFLFHYAQYTHAEDIRDKAFDLVFHITKNLNISLINYTNGISGIGVGIEYLIQHKFLEGNTDEVLEDFDEILYSQIHSQKLYLSMKDLFDLEKYFQTRLSNPQTEKQDFLQEAIQEIEKIKQLHVRVRSSATNESPKIQGISGNAGLGLALLSIIDKQHSTWIQLI